uniref:Uncharacterized protein n=1 Tax=Arion vulgaris TaxID=1028688 RepID=A0A0B7BIC0_9EUPU
MNIENRSAIIMKRNNNTNSTINIKDNGSRRNSCGAMFNSGKGFLIDKSTFSLRVYDIRLLIVTFGLLMGDCFAFCQYPDVSNCSLTDATAQQQDTKAQIGLHPLKNDSLPSAVKLVQPDHMFSAVSASIHQDKEDNFSKIVGIVVPFTCVILLAGLLFTTWKLCHRYKCYKPGAGLRKCSIFCDGCVSTPYVFKVSGSVADKSLDSRTAGTTTAQFSRISFHSTSMTSRKSASNQMLNKPRQNFNVVYTSLRYNNSSSRSSLSRQNSPLAARNNARKASVSRLSAIATLSRISEHTIEIHQEVKHDVSDNHNYNRLKYNKLCLADQTLGSVYIGDPSQRNNQTQSPSHLLGLSHHLSSSQTRSSSCKLTSSHKRGSSYKLSSSHNRGSNHQLSSSHNRGSSFKLSSSHKRSSSPQLSSSHNRGSNPQLRSNEQINAKRREDLIHLHSSSHKYLSAHIVV